MITVADLREILKDVPDHFVVCVFDAQGATRPIEKPNAALLGPVSDNVPALLLTPIGTFREAPAEG